MVHAAIDGGLVSFCPVVAGNTRTDPAALWQCRSL